MIVVLGHLDKAAYPPGGMGSIRGTIRLFDPIMRGSISNGRAYSYPTSQVACYVQICAVIDLLVVFPDFNTQDS